MCQQGDEGNVMGAITLLGILHLTIQQEMQEESLKLMGSMPNPCDICGKQSGPESSFSMRTSVPHCQYHSTCCILIHSSLMLHTVNVQGIMK